MNTLEIGKNVFKSEIDALQKTLDSLDSVFEEIVEMLVECNGKVVVTGLGKSGKVGKKMASTFSSLGSPSVFLNPTDALHGDIGLISSDDIVLAISYSGEAAEIKSMIPIIKSIGSKIITITGAMNSTLAKESDAAAILPSFDEACALGLAPTSSTTATLCYGDAIAVSVSIRKGYKKEDFLKNHPWGELGKR